MMEISTKADMLRPACWHGADDTLTIAYDYIGRARYVEMKSPHGYAKAEESIRMAILALVESLACIRVLRYEDDLARDNQTMEGHDDNLTGERPGGLA